MQEDNPIREDFEDFEIENLPEIKDIAHLNEPDELFVVPLTRRPFFPGMAAPIVIEVGAYYNVLKLIANAPQKLIGLFLTKKENADVYKIGLKDLYQVGVCARVLRVVPIETGGAQVVLNMEKRISILGPTAKKEKNLKAKVNYNIDRKIKVTKEIKAYSISIITTIKELLKLNPLFKEELQIFLGQSDFTEPGKLADFAVALTTASRKELQDVLETFDVVKRIDKALSLLKKELDLSKLQSSINQKIEATISKTQREFFLKEQLKTIKKELGLEKDDRTVDVEKFEERLKKRKLSEEISRVVQDEMEKLQVLEPQSAEYSVGRNYLDWLTIIPWGILSKETRDLDKAEKILEKDHYGLEDVKARILELIGVGKLTKGLKGNILCLLGPPGVGKTSIGKSIARALNRKFFRFSVGGMRDEAEIKGHRRTYIGAMPGKLVQALKVTQAMNPVIMIDEIDKMGASYQGDPASALLEVLDSEQNIEFLDHYLDVRCDLSNILFVLTANVADTIPDPLKDRMDILHLSGYILEEKLAIAQRYLVVKHRKLMGLRANQMTFTKQALINIINGYAREAGVRSLENYIKKILRKVALKIVKSQETKGKKTIKKIEISEKNLEEYIGKPIFTSDRYYEKTPIGVVMGLAWTSMGGATLYVEATKVEAPKTEMKLTGQAGDVMKESSQIAWTYLNAHFREYSKAKSFFKDSSVHLHIPEGATPKDGPSAGVTMVTALLSLLENKQVRSDLAMTGELTLTGKVLPIGGLKEKLIAARRVNANVLIFPKDNRRDFDELPDYLKKGLEVYFVDYYSEVYQIAFGQPKKKNEKHQKVAKRAPKKSHRSKRSKK